MSDSSDSVSTGQHLEERPIWGLDNQLSYRELYGTQPLVGSFYK